MDLHTGGHIFIEGSLCYCRFRMDLLTRTLIYVGRFVLSLRMDLQTGRHILMEGSLF